MFGNLIPIKHDGFYTIAVSNQVFLATARLWVIELQGFQRRHRCMRWENGKLVGNPPVEPIA